ncbi:MAG TPA: hypothetical protein VFO01_11465 [Trebonia sp.]|nr:hypothetical protein [Trebonia sp.]
MAGLTDLDEKFPDAGIPALLADAIGVYERAEAEEEARRARSTAQWESGRAEQQRQRELARTAECPTCGRAPGAGCRTSSGAYVNGFHGPRLRAATDPGWKGHDSRAPHPGPAS